MRNSMNHWIISDTHFGHDKLVKDGLRPKMFEGLILDSIVRSVRPDDVFIHLGDVAFYNVAGWHNTLISALKCRHKVLVLGNHDRNTIGWYYKRGWDFVCNRFDLRIYGMEFAFTHKPILDPAGCFFDVNVHGHLHDGNHRNVETDKWNYLINIESTLAPVTLRSIAEKYKLG